MAKPFDVTTKHLVQMRPTDWLRFLNLPGDAVEIIDADLSTVTTEADRVLRVRHPVLYLTHLEFTARVDDIEERTLRYNVLLHYEYQLSVVSVIIVLRASAETVGKRLTGALRLEGPDGALVVEFRYQVVRVWELEVEAILSGGLATLPLAALADDAQNHLPSVINRMQKRLDAEATEQEAREIWSSAYILMGLRHKPDAINDLLKGVRQMHESSTYQAILTEGKTVGIIEGKNIGIIEGKMEGKIEGELGEARRLLILLGERRLGAPSIAVQERLAAIDSRERMEALALRVSEVEAWDELLAE